MVHGPKQKCEPAWSELHPDHFPSPFLLQLPGIFKHHFHPQYLIQVLQTFIFTLNTLLQLKLGNFPPLSVLCFWALPTAPSPSPMGLVSSDITLTSHHRTLLVSTRHLILAFLYISAPKLEFRKKRDRPELQKPTKVASV